MAEHTNTTSKIPTIKALRPIFVENLPSKIELNSGHNFDKLKLAANLSILVNLQYTFEIEDSKFGFLHQDLRIIF